MHYKLATFLLSILSFAVLSPDAVGQELRRQVSLGTGLEVQDSRVVITAVAPNSTAAAADLAPGDAVLRIADATIDSPDQLVQALRRYRAGDRATFVVDRAGQRIEKNVVFKPKPLETSPDFEIRYDVVVANGVKHRTIVTKPKGAGPFPAVLLIGGLGCYSLDGLSPANPLRLILSGLTRQGFATMRVEKSGEGDSEGPSCTSADADLPLAVARSVAGVRALKGYAFVKPNEVFVFAHSLGPVEGALVVNEVPVAGMIAAETIGRDWLTYHGEIAYSQPLLLGKPYDEVEAQARLHMRCHVRFYLQKDTPEMLARDAADCLDHLLVSVVSYRYLQQIADVSLPALWKKVDIPVLVIYGTSDPTTDAGESRYLVDMINSFHPGRASYVEIAGMNHQFDRAATKKDGLLVMMGQKPPGEFETSVLTATEDWLQKLTRG